MEGQLTGWVGVKKRPGKRLCRWRTSSSCLHRCRLGNLFDGQTLPSFLDSCSFLWAGLVLRSRGHASSSSHPRGLAWHTVGTWLTPTWTELIAHWLLLSWREPRPLLPLGMSHLFHKLLPKAATPVPSFLVVGRCWQPKCQKAREPARQSGPLRLVCIYERRGSVYSQETRKGTPSRKRKPACFSLTCPVLWPEVHHQLSMLPE